MNELVKGLEPAINKLSEVFCVSVDTIRDNGMQYIMMYGKYALVQNLILDIFLGALISCLVGVVGGLISNMYFDSQYEYNEEKQMKKAWTAFIKKVLVPIMVAIIILTLMFDLIPYFVSPEIYSIKAVMDLIQS